MSDKTSTVTTALTSTDLLSVARRVDQAALAGQECFGKPASFESTMALARGIADIKAALSDEVMDGYIMPLMNTDVGFKTDRDPKTWAYRDPKGNLVEKDGSPFRMYSREEVREVVACMMLRGFYPVNNEMNIIAGNGYAARNGLKRRCEQWPGVTDLKVDFGVPRTVGEKGALVAVKARWKKDGVADSIEAEIPVRVNSFMGTDGIIGKSERKIYKRIFDRLSGVTTPDGEVGDDVEVLAGAAAAPGAKVAAPSFDAGKSQDAEVVKEPKLEVVKEEGKGEPGCTVAQGSLRDFVTASGFTLEDLLAWGKATGNITPSQAEKYKEGFHAFDDAHAARLLKAKAGLVNGLKGLKK